MIDKFYNYIIEKVCEIVINYYMFNKDKEAEIYVKLLLKIMIFLSINKYNISLIAK